MNDLNLFLSATESGSGGIVKTVNKAIEYPFLYITQITDVELAHLVGSTIKRDKEENHLALYLKTESGGYRMLGYLEVCFDSIIRMQHLKYHPIFLKVAKNSEKELTGELFDSLLLTR